MVSRVLKVHSNKSCLFEHNESYCRIQHFRTTTKVQSNNKIRSWNPIFLSWPFNDLFLEIKCLYYFCDMYVKASKSVQLSVWIKLTLSVYKLRNSNAERWVCIILHYMQVFSIICFTDSFVGVWAVQLSAIHSLWISMCHSTDYHVSCQPVTFL